MIEKFETGQNYGHFIRFKNEIEPNVIEYGRLAQYSKAHFRHQTGCGIIGHGRLDQSQQAYFNHPLN